MSDRPGSAGLRSNYTRGLNKTVVHSGDTWRSTTVLSFHPSSLNQELFVNIKVPAEVINRVDLMGHPEFGFHFKVDLDFVNDTAIIPFPPASTIDTEEWRMWTRITPLNVVGFF